MRSPVGARWLEAGAIVLLVAGAGLVLAAPHVAPAPPAAGPGPFETCSAVQLAVFPIDGTPDRSGHEAYDALSGTQRSVFDEARAADGDFVRVRDRDRMAAADSLPAHVAVDGAVYRAHGIRANCRDRPWYGPLVDPLGRVLLGLGLLAGAVAGWRRLGY